MIYAVQVRTKKLKQGNNKKKISETWCSRMFILQLVSQLNSSLCDESLLRGNPGDNRCALVPSTRRLRVIKVWMEEVEEGD